ncbi:MAG: hypothetical protein LBD53_08740 [Tannerella sp.]|jgi:hypothetical protein|nr:hypothetical protein [Tannerella sp.]
MARPIKPTPILTGRDARRFEKETENVQKIPREERDEMHRAYELFKRIAVFPL